MKRRRRRYDGYHEYVDVTVQRLHIPLNPVNGSDAVGTDDLDHPQMSRERDLLDCP
jgi:hypothetical protein